MGSLVDPVGPGQSEIAKVYRLLDVLDQQLRYLGERGAKVAVHQRNLSKWGRVPLMLDIGWSAGVGNPEHVVTEATLDQIEGLSSFLDGKVLTFDDTRLPSLRRIVDQADALLTDDPHLDPTLASYLRRLLAAIRSALDDEAAGRLFDYTSAVEQLLVAFQAAAETAGPENKEGWRSMAKQIVVGVAVGLGIEAGKMLGIESAS
ncbi:hypothetical protein GCM10010489_40440 [Microbacterium saperdae]|uniref:Uncharacterized protein n=2 Tax=Microbacterium saperdae TaxID=69368 RepID=A0A543BIS7_9MICO|nr:hypothetical protein FB560_0297 [Microbacterium saperdae]GGM64792.1 hypothetical protein GCM10010489_40440 [Microbacterium saperdae]